MKFRKFTPDDCEFCFKIRSTAYIKLFYDELDSDAVATCINTFMPSDYIKMKDDQEIFIVEYENTPIGFLTIKRTNNTEVEIPLIYFDLNHLGKGAGTASIKFIEEWVLTNWQDVDTLWLDTIIPQYNSGFYKKAGFTENSETQCDFNGKKVKAIRFTKKIK